MKKIIISNSLPFHFFLVHIQIVSMITISPNVGKNNNNNGPTKSPKRLQLNKIDSEYLNQTERHRRLIPYMTFYIPTNDYFPVNQAYSLTPTSTVGIFNICFVFTYLHTHIFYLNFHLMEINEKIFQLK